jgi:hypothetical protein
MTHATLAGLRPATLPTHVHERRAASAWALRGLLLAGCVMAMALAAARTDPAAYVRADPALAHLLRGMALLKGGIVAVALALVLWRFGWRVGKFTSAVYLVTCWTLTGTTMLVWQLTAIPAAAVAFHGALIGMVLAAWRDDLGWHPSPGL